MDYEKINYAMDDIIKIVNWFNKKNDYKYNLQFLETLSISLLGYYLVFGPSIFGNLQKVLEVVCIQPCNDIDEYDDNILKLNPYFYDDCLERMPVTTMNVKLDDKHQFSYFEPYVTYIMEDYLMDVTHLLHELIHVNDAVNGFIEKRGENFVDINMNFSREHIDTMDTEKCDGGNHAFSEFAAVSFENKALFALAGLDSEKVNFPFLKRFVFELMNKKGNISRGYGDIYAVIKDLADNTVFFSLMINNYYLVSNEEQFKKEYESLGNDLSYIKLKNIIESLFGLDQVDSRFFRICQMTMEEIVKFNRDTGYEPEKKMLLVLN